MIVGETVTVHRRVETGEDRYGQPVYDWEAEDVENVLTAPGPRADLSEAERPDGYKVVWNLHFPKSFTGSLANARISVRGGEPLDVIGDPQPYLDANTPGLWNRPVEVWRAEG